MFHFRNKEKIVQLKNKLLLALFIFTSILLFGNSKAYAANVSEAGITYSFYDNSCSSFVITDLTSEAVTDDMLFVPAFVDETPVIGFDILSLADNEVYNSLEKVEFEEGIELIIDYSFLGHQNLKEVVLHDGLTEICDGAFAECAKLQKITFPDTLTDIDNYVFTGCSKLKTVSFSKELTYIGEYAFSETGLKTVKLPNNCIYIGKYAFSECPKLTTITLPAELETVNTGLLRGCVSLNKVTFGKKTKDIAADTFNDCSKLKEIVFKGSAPRITKKFTVPKKTEFFCKSKYYDAFKKALNKSSVIKKNKNKLSIVK